MPVETLQHDVLVQPDLGGRYKPDSSLADTIVIARPADRNLPITEPQELEKKSIELAPNLRINPHLKEAGYDVLMEMGRFFRDVNTNLSMGKSLAEAVSISAGELEVGLRSFDLEIIKSRPVLPHLNRFGLKDGKLRMVGSSGEPVVDGITAKERNGSVLQASHSIENFLLSAPNNSFAVLMNPAGWNGFVDDYGREAEPHLNAEVMVFWKDQNGDAKGLTIVADLSEEQASQVMVSLGVGLLVPSEVEGDSSEVKARERLASIVRNPALLSLPRVYANPFEYVLDKILAERGRGDFRLLQRDGSWEIRPVQVVREDIQRFDELLLFGMEEERLVTEPKQFILGNVTSLGDRSTQQEIINRVEKAILLLTREQIKPASASVIPGEVLRSRGPQDRGARIYTNRLNDDFTPEIMFLKTRAGCPARVSSGRSLRGISFGSSVGGVSWVSLES